MTPPSISGDLGASSPPVQTLRVDIATMRILLGTTSQKIAGDRSRPIIQNLGPGTVYLDTDGDVDSTSGLKIDVGTVYEFPTAGAENVGIFIVADQANTDVRVVEIG